MLLKASYLRAGMGGN